MREGIKHPPKNNISQRRETERQKLFNRGKGIPKRLANNPQIRTILMADGLVYPPNRLIISPPIITPKMGPVKITTAYVMNTVYSEISNYYYRNSLIQNQMQVTTKYIADRDREHTINTFLLIKF